MKRTLRGLVVTFGLLFLASCASTSTRMERPDHKKRRFSREDMMKMRERSLARDKAPPLGAEAPNFTLQTQDGSRTVELASFRGKKPVVLVFGSYT